MAATAKDPCQLCSSVSALRGEGGLSVFHYATPCPHVASTFDAFKLSPYSDAGARKRQAEAEVIWKATMLVSAYLELDGLHGALIPVVPEVEDLRLALRALATELES